MLGLTTLGLFHTAIALLAVVSGFVAIATSGTITVKRTAGCVFILTTIVTSVTAFGIFQRGGFNIAHALAMLALVTLAVSYGAERTGVFGRASPYLSALGYSFVLFLHFVPATAETLTRLPLAAPYLTSPEDPKVQPIVGAFFLTFIVGAGVQLRRIGRQQGRAVPIGA